MQLLCIVNPWITFYIMSLAPDILDTAVINSNRRLFAKIAVSIFDFHGFHSDARF